MVQESLSGKLPMPSTIIKIQKFGKMFYFDGSFHDDHIINTIKNTQDFYESDLLDWLTYINLPDGDVIDVGACMGNHSVYFASILERRVFAFEPNPKAYSLLTKNISLNQCEDIIISHDLGLGKEEKYANIVEQNIKNLGATRLGITDKGNLLIKPLDKIFSEHINKISLIKMDVEGLEFDVIFGAKKIIEEHQPVLAIECSNEKRLHAMCKIMQEFNYIPINIFCATPVVIFCPTTIQKKLLWGQSSSFERHYCAYKQNLHLITKQNKLYKQFFVFQGKNKMVSTFERSIIDVILLPFKIITSLLRRFREKNGTIFKQD